MKNMKIVTIALLIAALPLAPAAFAGERDHGRHESRGPVHSGGHDDRGRHWGHEHRHDRHYRHYRHDDHRYRHSAYRHDGGYENRGWDNHRTQVVLPLPPLPPLPVFVVPKQHKGHLVLR